MTTGRINQVAFLTDASVAREGRRARRSRRPEATEAVVRSMRAINAEFGPTETVRDGLPPSRYSASESSGRSSRTETAAHG